MECSTIWTLKTVNRALEQSVEKEEEVGQGRTKMKKRKTLVTTTSTCLIPLLMTICLVKTSTSAKGERVCMYSHLHWFLSSFSDEEDIGADTGITEENKAVLEKVRMNTRQEFLQQQQQHPGGTAGASAPGSTSSVRASDRLMRELRDIYRSQNFKDGILSVRRISPSVACLYCRLVLC